MTAALLFQPSTYSRWHWRLLGSLLMDISFDDAASLQNNLDDFEDDADEDVINNRTSSYAVNRSNVPVTMVAKLDSLDHSVPQEDQDQGEDYRHFEWVRESEIKAERKLQCTVTQIQPTGTLYI